MRATWTLMLVPSLLLAPAATALVDVDRARALLEAGDALAAMDLLAAALPEGDRPTVLLFAEAAVAAGEPGRAVEVLDALAGAKDPEALLWTGRAFLAWADLTAADGGGPEDVGFHLAEALAWLEEAAAAAPAGDARAAVEAGYLALHDFGDHEKALQLADAALARGEDAEARLLRGTAGAHAYAAAKGGEHEDARWKAAVADLRAVAEALPEDGEPWWQLLWLYEDAGRASDAVAAAARHHELSEGMDLSVLLRLALRYAAEGRAEAAREALQLMVERGRDELVALLGAQDDPTAATVTLGSAVLPLLQSGRLADARALLEPLLAAEPQDAGIWNNYALACRDGGSAAELRGRREEAAGLYEASYAAYEKALSLAPDDPRLLNDTALVLQYHLRRDLGRARDLYERAIAQAEARLAAAPERELAAELRSALVDARNNLARL